MKNTKYVEIKDEGDLEQLLIGSYLGDGCFVKISGAAKNSRFSLAHSLKQKDYFMLKWNIFKKYGLDGKVSENKIFSTRYKDGYFEEIRFKSKTHPIFTLFRNQGYDVSKKLNIDLIQNIDKFALAIWFMDDGNRTNDSCEINCQKFSYEDKENLRNILQNTFNLTVNITNNTLYIPKNSFIYFKGLINDYIIDSLKYKLEPYKGSV